MRQKFPETYEDSPWGHPVFKVGANKMFGTMGNDEPLQVTLKLTAEERGVALELPFVRQKGRFTPLRA